MQLIKIFCLLACLGLSLGDDFGVEFNNIFLIQYDVNGLWANTTLYTDWDWVTGASATAGSYNPPQLIYSSNLTETFLDLDNSLIDLYNITHDELIYGQPVYETSNCTFEYRIGLNFDSPHNGTISINGDVYQESPFARKQYTFTYLTPVEQMNNFTLDLLDLSTLQPVNITIQFGYISAVMMTQYNEDRPYSFEINFPMFIVNDFLYIPVTSFDQNYIQPFAVDNLWVTFRDTFNDFNQCLPYTL